MFSEILKIKPQLDTADAVKMETALTQRFGKISKKFASGLGKAILGGGVAGLALGIVDKILSPLKETQETIERMLKQSDDLVTNAKQFGTTSGKLFKLQQFGKAAGLEPDSLFMLMQKFQSSVAEAEADPNKQSAVRNFTGRADMADAFFEFIQALKEVPDKNRQVLIQQEVFGEKQILKMSDFLNSDFREVLKTTGLQGSETYTAAIEPMGKLADQRDELKAGLEANDLLKKATLINKNMIFGQAGLDQVNLDRENSKLKRFNESAAIELASTKLQELLEKGIGELTKLVMEATSFNSLVQKISVDRIWRGITGGGKDK